MTPRVDDPTGAARAGESGGQDLFELLPAALVEVDARLVVTRANELAARTLGRVEALAGRPLFEATVLSHALEPALRAVLASGAPFSFWGYPVEGAAHQGPGDVSFWDVTLKRLPSSEPGAGAPALLLFAVEVTDRAMRIFGGHGLVQGAFPIQRMFMDARVSIVTVGSSDIQKRAIARYMGLACD